MGEPQKKGGDQIFKVQWEEAKGEGLQFLT